MSEVERTSTRTSLIDILDRVLDKGIVVDAWVRVSVVGVDLITMEARIVVSSIETYVNRADAVARLPTGLTTLSRAPVPPHLPVGSSGAVAPVAANLKGAANLKARKRRRRTES
jgi:gas vesicle structural protein